MKSLEHRICNAPMATPAGKGKPAVWGTINNFFGDVEIYDVPNAKTICKAKPGMAVHMLEAVITGEGRSSCNVRLTTGRMLTMFNRSAVFVS